MYLVRRKKSNCQNCQYPLLENYSFCPNCGQENSDKLVAFRTLVSEFFSNYIAYDSKLGRTIGPFLFKPGLLTNEFIKGKRVKYMHPLRLYFAVSFFYFLILSSFISGQVKDDAINFGNEENVPSADSLNQAINESVANNTDLAGKEKERADSVLKTLLGGGENIKNTADTSRITFGRKQSKPSFLGKLLKTPQITAEQVLDSLDTEKSQLNLILARQAIKLANEKGNNIVSYLISKASLMMFLLLPFFALILKLFYIRTKRLYVEHITFTLHIHTFLFLISSVAMLTARFWPNEWIYQLTIFTIFIYFLISFKRVYRQGWFKTLLKMFILFVSYAFSFSIFMGVTILLSLLLF